MIRSMQSAGLPAAAPASALQDEPASVDRFGEIAATATAVSVSSPRADMAIRAAGDIAEIVLLLSPGEVTELSPPVLQMIQQRVHALALAICSLLDDAGGDPIEHIRAALYPSEIGSPQ